jgi:hypothetical protein
MLDDTAFIAQCRQLLFAGDPEQLRYIRPKACELCRFFAECCRRRCLLMLFLKDKVDFDCTCMQRPCSTRCQGFVGGSPETSRLSRMSNICPFRLSAALPRGQKL